MKTELALENNLMSLQKLKIGSNNRTEKIARGTFWKINVCLSKSIQIYHYLKKYLKFNFHNILLPFKVYANVVRVCVGGVCYSLFSNWNSSARVKIALRLGLAACWINGMPLLCCGCMQKVWRDRKVVRFFFLIH